MATGASVPVTVSFHSLGISPRELLLNRLVFDLTGVEPQDWSAGVASSDVKLIQCILLALKLLGFVGAMWRYIRCRPNLRASFCTPPKAKGTITVQAGGRERCCKWFYCCPRYGVVAANRPQELQYLTHLIPLSRAPYALSGAEPTWSPGPLLSQVAEYRGLEGIL